MDMKVRLVIQIMCFFVCTFVGSIHASSNNLNFNVISNNSSVQPMTPNKYDLEVDGIFYRITSIDNLTLRVVGERMYIREKL